METPAGSRRRRAHRHREARPRRRARPHPEPGTEFRPMIADQVALRVTPSQHRQLARWAKCARLTYNWALSEWRRQYTDHREARDASSDPRGVPPKPSANGLVHLFTVLRQAGRLPSWAQEPLASSVTGRDHRIRGGPDGDRRHGDAEPAHGRASEDALNELRLIHRVPRSPEMASPRRRGARSAARGAAGAHPRDHVPAGGQSAVLRELPLGAGQLLAVGEVLEVPGQGRAPLELPQRSYADPRRPDRGLRRPPGGTCTPRRTPSAGLGSRRRRRGRGGSPLRVARCLRRSARPGAWPPRRGIRRTGRRTPTVSRP